MVNSEPEESIAFIEIGLLGYFTNNRIIDLCGLVTPQVIPYVAQKKWAWGFWHFKPDYFLYANHFKGILRRIIRDKRFKKNYRPVKRFSLFGRYDLIVFRRIKKNSIK